jgi:TPR repeat protein
LNIYSLSPDKEPAMTVESTTREGIRSEEELRAAAASDNNAKLELAVRLLDGLQMKRNVREGETLLRELAEAGDTDSMLELGGRLLDGKSVKSATKEGEAWLRKAAATGTKSAMARLGDRLVSGNRMPQNRAEGKEWLRKAVDAGDVDAMSTLGLVCYETGEHAEAAKYFLMGVKAGVVAEGNNLAYIIRRREVPADMEVPTLNELLDPLLADKSPLALVNQALRLAAGIQAEVDWEKADRVMADIGTREQAADVFNWWWGLADRGDAEGHLVLAWLARHSLVQDPNGLNVPKRMARARKGGWNAPAWMDQVKR